MGLIVWFSVFNIPNTKVHISRNTKSFYLPVQLCYINEQPHKKGHQVDAELAPFQIGTKYMIKCVKTLKELNVKLEQWPILISDSQTCLSLCSRTSNALNLSTPLVVSRVKEGFTNANLFFSPGSTFSKSEYLLTRYQQNLQALII